MNNYQRWAELIFHPQLCVAVIQTKDSWLRLSADESAAGGPLGSPPPSVDLHVLQLPFGLIHIQIWFNQQVVASQEFTVRPKVNSLYTVRQRGERFMERQQWLLAGELLCHCCRAKLLGITVPTAAAARDVHSNRTYKRKTKSMLWLCKCNFS